MKGYAPKPTIGPPHMGIFSEIGHKLGKWHDVGYWRLGLCRVTPRWSLLFLSSSMSHPGRSTRVRHEPSDCPCEIDLHLLDYISGGAGDPNQCGRCEPCPIPVTH